MYLFICLQFLWETLVFKGAIFFITLLTGQLSETNLTCLVRVERKEKMVKNSTASESQAYVMFIIFKQVSFIPKVGNIICL